MADFRFRFRAEAHAKYGDQWYELNFADLAEKIDGGVLETFEEETNVGIFGELPELLGKKGFRATRLTMFLTMLAAGRKLKWLAFRRDNATDPRFVEWDNDDPAEEGEQSDPPPPPPNREQRRAAAKVKPSET